MRKRQSLLKSIECALLGILSIWREERNFKIGVLCALSSCLLLILSRASHIWWIAFVICIGTVLSAELLNTAVEKAIDRLHPESHPQLRLAKDYAAGAVWLLSMMSFVVFLIFCIQRLS